MEVDHAPPQKERTLKKYSEGFGKDRFNGAIGEYWCRPLEVLSLGWTDGGVTERLNGSGIAKKK
jgi:hypothetical protein